MSQYIFSSNKTIQHLHTSGTGQIAMVFKAVRRDVASHSFESPRRCLGDHKARQGDAICSTQENGEGIKKKNEKVKEEGQGT